MDQSNFTRIWWQIHPNSPGFGGGSIQIYGDSVEDPSKFPGIWWQIPWIVIPTGIGILPFPPSQLGSLCHPCVMKFGGCWILASGFLQIPGIPLELQPIRSHWNCDLCEIFPCLRSREWWQDLLLEGEDKRDEEPAEFSNF